MHEAEHGRIPPNAIITINSGWARKYPDPNLVFGTQNLDDPKTFHFPGWSLNACQFLLQQRQVYQPIAFYKTLQLIFVKILYNATKELKTNTNKLTNKKIYDI